MAEERIRVWITKYALTEGIQLVDAEWSPAFPSMVSYGGEGLCRQNAHGEGNDWHRTPKAAVRRAEEMRRKKIASLRKQIVKLEAMTFAAPASDE